MREPRGGLQQLDVVLGHAGVKLSEVREVQDHRPLSLVKVAPLPLLA